MQTSGVLTAHHLHIRHVSRGFILQQPQHSKHPLHGVFRHFFADIYCMLKARAASKKENVNVHDTASHSTTAANQNTFGSISARTSFKTCRSCVGSRESNVIRLKLFLNGSLLSCSIMNFSCSPIFLAAENSLTVSFDCFPN